MKGKLISGVIVLVIIGAIVGINYYEPDRATERQTELQAQTEEELGEINELEEESEAELAKQEAEEDELEEIIQKVQSENNAEDEPEAVVPSDGDYRVRFECSMGDFIVTVRENLAPHGAKQLRAAVQDGVYDGARFFRVVPGFVAQFGIPGDPTLAEKWRDKTIPDDPVKSSNTRGTLTFATSGPNSRTSQLFINFGDNTRLDGMGFAPLGEVTEGMENVDNIFSGHGEKPDQAAIQRSGNRYLEAAYPELDYIIKAEILPMEEESVVDNAVDAVEDAVDGAADAAQDAIEGAADAVEGAVEDVADTVSDPGDQAA